MVGLINIEADNGDKTAEWRAKANFLAGYLAGLHYKLGEFEGLEQQREDIPDILKELGFPAPGGKKA